MKWWYPQESPVAGSLKTLGHSAHDKHCSPLGDAGTLARIWTMPFAGFAVVFGITSHRRRCGVRPMAPTRPTTRYGSYAIILPD